MILLILLAIPLIVATVGLIISKGRFNWLEAVIQVAVGLALMGGGYFAARYVKTVDTEIWNGRIATKDHGQHGCCHSYSCNCIPSCSTDSKGNSSCTEICSTCYEHSYDLYWSASTTNNETVFSDRCNSPHTDAPAVWNRIKLGEPTAVEHTYINYIKGVPGKFFSRPWLIDRYKGKLPSYPRVYNLYNANRFMLSAVGESMPDVAKLNRELSQINGNLGRMKQVNIIVVVTAESSSEYAEALSEAWLGGKKNDLIVVVGISSFPKLEWTKVISWTDAKDVKESIEHRIMELGEFDGHKLLSVVEQEIIARFRHKSMSDFRYLLKETEPPKWAFAILIVLGLVVSGGLQVWFWLNDPFRKDKK